MDLIWDGIREAARLWWAGDGEIIEIDSRPSDAIALGIATEVPIYVEEFVLDEAQSDL